MVAKDPSVKTKRFVSDFYKLATLQKELLRNAVDLTDGSSKEAGIIVYSTCSLSLEENEAVIVSVYRRKIVFLTGLYSPSAKSTVGRYRSRFWISGNHFEQRKNIPSIIKTRQKILPTH